MYIGNLMISQNSLRSMETLYNLTGLARSGVLFSADVIQQGTPLIEIVRFPNGDHMIHNGHHRCVAIWASRRKELDPSEFFVSEYTYDDYLQINLDRWVTPFDPRTEVRLADYRDWKYQVNTMRMLHGNQEAIDFIHRNANRYKESRVMENFQDLAMASLIELNEFIERKWISR